VLRQPRASRFVLHIETSPSISILSFIKDYCISPLLPTLGSLEERLGKAVLRVYHGMLESIWQERKYRFDV
jgi:hypothetical protein